MKKALVVALCVMLGVAMVAPANAAFTYFTCTVSATGGISNGSVYAILTDAATPSTFGPIQLTLDNSTGQANQYLAAALTAWSTGGKVRVLANTPVNAFDTIFGVACTN